MYSGCPDSSEYERGRSLSLPRDALNTYLSDQNRLKLVHYRSRPPSANSVNGSNVFTQGVGPHKDSSGWMTFLLQASPPQIKGLQALNKIGDWIDVPTIPGTFVVNMGQAFEVVTNGLCKATTHRVILDSAGVGIDSVIDRYSVPFFQGVRKDLRKAEMRALWKHFALLERELLKDDIDGVEEAEEGRGMDSAFLKGLYDTWGESQLRTKIRSHRDVGQRWYADVYEKYVIDDL